MTDATRTTVLKGTREGFGDALIELGTKDKRIVVLTSDLSESMRTLEFRKLFPDRFFACGVAEQDMVSTAAGLALTGKIAFCTTFGVFASGRAWEQVRVSVCASNSNVKIGGGHSGITVGEDGSTHQAIEEISLMRVLPRMKILVPCDYIETKKATIAAAYAPGPCYIRFGRPKVPVITDDAMPFNIGKANVMAEGKDATVIACGIMVSEALKAADTLVGENIRIRVLNMHTVKPLDVQAIIDSARLTGAIVTAEEHQLNGGLGEAVARITACNIPVPVEMVGVDDRFGESGAPDELIDKFGLNASSIASQVKKVLLRKR